jgi:hypothetical protein
MSPPSSGSNNKPSKIPAENYMANEALSLDPEYVENIFLRNVGWFSAYYTALYVLQKTELFITTAV